ncbi:exonuclease [Xanthomonas phage X1]|nr:exonuclease [Xanthomonas phage X1]
MSDAPFHLSIDTETLGMRENTVVLSIGVAAFQLVPGAKNDYDKIIRDGFHVKFNVKEQIVNYKRTTDQSTIDWWKTQEPAAQKILKPSEEDVDMASGLTMLNDWIKRSGYRWKDSFVWSRGTYFDFPKLEHMYLQAGVKCGFNTWKIRDTRTMIDVLTGSENGQYEPAGGFPRNFLKHDALHDAAMDAYRMVEIFNLAAGGEPDDGPPWKE